MTDESQQFWQEILTPLLHAFADHTSADQLAKLRDEARRDPEAPPAVLAVIDTLYQLRAEVDHI